MMRRPISAVVSTVMVLAVVLAGCSGKSDPPAAGRLTVDGQAEILHPGEDRREVTGSRDLDAGDRVRVRQGTAVIQLRDDRRFELRQGSDLELLPREATNDILPTLVAGDLLVVSDARPLVVAAGGAEIAVQGDARVSRGVSLLVATYEGTAQLSTGGATITVPALRQASLPPTGTFPTNVAPLEYSSNDGWDQRYLSDAMDLSNQLNGRSDGFTSQLGPTEGRSVNFFRERFPRLAAEPAFTAALLNPARAPGETLVGAAVTLEGTRGTFAERWASVFAFRDQGAPWGLVAMDQGVARVPLLNAIDAAISRGPTQFAVGPPGRPPTSLNPPISGGATSSVPRATTPTTAGRPRPGATTTTTTAPAPGGAPNTTITGPLNTGGPLDDPVNGVVDTLTGLLRSLGDQ